MGSATVIQSLWIGGTLSPVEVLCVRSFLANGFAFHLYVYDRPDNLPEGVTILEARDIVPEHHIFRVNGKIALFADYFRFVLLSKKGGVWTDMDMVCLKPFEVNEDVVLAREDDTHVAIGFMKFPPHHPLVERLLHRAEYPPTQYVSLPRIDHYFQKNFGTLYKGVFRFFVRWITFTRIRRIKTFSRTTRWGTLMGPVALTEEYSHLNRSLYTLRPAQVYPVPYHEWELIFKADHALSIDTSEALMIHLWNDMMSRDRNFDKFALPAKGSYYANLCQQYGVHFNS